MKSVDGVACGRLERKHTLAAQAVLDGGVARPLQPLAGQERLDPRGVGGRGVALVLEEQQSRGELRGGRCAVGGNLVALGNGQWGVEVVPVLRARSKTAVRTTGEVKSM